MISRLGCSVHPFFIMILVRLGFVLVVSAVVVVVLFATGVFGGDDSGGEAAGARADEVNGGGESVGSVDVAGEACETTICCPDCSAFRVQRIIYGDTLVAGGGGRIRLFGVDTPEVGERCATQATNRLRQLAGTSFKVEPGPRARDPLDRSLYYLYTTAGESIDEILVQEGFGVAWRRDGQHRDVLVRLEQEAQQESVGCLW